VREKLQKKVLRSAFGSSKNIYAFNYHDIRRSTLYIVLCQINGVPSAEFTNDYTDTIYYYI